MSNSRGIKEQLAWMHSYLLGLLAKIKCSICSYQCENWYLSSVESHFTLIFPRGQLTQVYLLILSCRPSLTPYLRAAAGFLTQRLNFIKVTVKWNQTVLSTLRAHLPFVGLPFILDHDQSKARIEQDHSKALNFIRMNSVDVERRATEERESDDSDEGDKTTE